MTTKSTEKKTPLLPLLKDILTTKIKLAEQETKHNIDILMIALKNLIEQMKTDSILFKQIYDRIYFTGSFYEGLRVKNATEFDLNMILNFPLAATDMKVTTNNSPPSFANYRLVITTKTLSARHNWDQLKDILKKFFDGDYLSSEKIRRWLKGVVDHALLEMPKIPQIAEIKRKESGPAVTLFIFTHNKIKLDVDLVPVFEFKSPLWPDGLMKPKFIKSNPKITEQKKNWFLVPKPPPSEICNGMNVSHQWRLHFPGIEREVLHNKGCVKPVIKLMKLLRDKQKNWKILASYYLKTVVMWEVINQNNFDWNEKKMDIIFLIMLKKLLEYVGRSNLPYLFNKRYNLFIKMNSSHASNLQFQIKNIITDIEKDPQKIYLYM